MVRAHVKQSVEGKEVTTKKRASSKVKKQQQPSGVWLCKISGCNKKFAREADLKRHQRTTRLHMKPNSQPILCPQCDSTFTRTDALRRHQKSRHNGIIIDPVDSSNSKDTEGEGEGEDTSAPQSRSHSPGRSKVRKRKSLASASASTSAPVQTIMAQPDAPGPSTGSQSYYRQNTINPVFIPPRTPNGTADTSMYHQPQLPMSAARFHAWVPNPPWVPDKTNSPHPPSGPVAYGQPPPAGYYAPGAYYRTPHGQPVMPLHVLPHGIVTMQVNPTVPPQLNGNAANGDSAAPSSEPSAGSNSNIDPSLQEGPLLRTPENKAEGGSARGKSPETDTFAGSGLSPDVQKVLQAVLAIDSGPNVNVSTTQPSDPQLGSEEPESAGSLRDANQSALPTLMAVASDQQVSRPVPPADENRLVGTNDKDAMDVDADGEADTDGEEPLQDERPRESSSLPDGIKDLINEDSLSYASPS